METVPRRWTIATWLVPHAGDDTEAIVRALDASAADAIALQSVRERSLVEIGAALGMHHSWELSHHPRSRLLPGSAVGLAVLSPHHVTDSHSTVTNEHRSTWSTKRRIVQTALVERADHSASAIRHALGPVRSDHAPHGGMPMVRIRPEQVGVDASRAVELPPGSETIAAETSRPVADGAHLLSVTFELPWVQGDFPVA